jgi:DNA-binding transcriptional LysR family regulator
MTVMLNLNQLKVFRAVAECQNYSRAAQELFLSQPYVYVQIRDLEREYRCKLFDQVGKRAVLTEAGQALMEYANQILGLAEDAETAMRQFARLERGRLAIGAGVFAGNYLVPPLIALFKQQAPDINLSLGIFDEMGTRIAKRVSRYELDLVFTAAKPVAPDLLTEELWQVRLVPCVGANHRFALLPEVGVAEFAEETVLWFGGRRSTVTRRVAEGALTECGVQARSSMVLGSTEAIKQVLIGGHGVSVLPWPAIAAEVKNKQLVVLRIPGFHAEYSVQCVRHRYRNLSPAAELFLRLAKEWTPCHPDDAERTGPLAEPKATFASASAGARWR